MDPNDSMFRKRMMAFPALVTSCSVEWYAPWENEALQVRLQRELFSSKFLTGSGGSQAQSELGDPRKEIADFEPHRCRSVCRNPSEYEGIFSEIFGRDETSILCDHCLLFRISAGFPGTYILAVSKILTLLRAAWTPSSKRRRITPKG